MLGVASPALLGNSAAIVRARLQLGQMAQRPRASVLILGERGTGKRLCSTLLHESTYPNGHYFELSHASQLPELEARLSALFRNRAAQSTPGLTVFVPNFAAAVDGIQRCAARLLAEQRLPMRLIASSASAPPGANSVELRRLEPTCRFAFALRLPPLRERSEDIALLAQHFAQRAARGGLPLHFSAADTARMQRYPWPGNVPELAAVVAAHAVKSRLRWPARVTS